MLLELKVADRIRITDFNQTNEYLQASNLRLGLIIAFTPKGVKIRRVANPK